MKRIVRNIIVSAGILLLAGIICAINFDDIRLFPPKTSGPCFKSGKQIGSDDCDIPIPSTDEQVEQQKKVMIDSSQHTYSHAEMWDVINGFTRALEDSASLYQSKIISILNSPGREAYLAEREAYSNWYANQKFMSYHVVCEIWELYIGGTAGGTLECMHPYDRANPNAAEQMILFNALTKQAYAASFQASATMEEILSAKDSLVAELKSTYSLIDNEDNWRSLDHTADEVDEFITIDLSLFQKWITTRKAFEACLDSDLRSIYASQTGYWLDLYHKTIQGGFIHETD